MFKNETASQKSPVFKKNILLRTNAIICLIIILGFMVTAMLSYKANYQASIENIEQVSKLTSEGIYHQITTIFTKPVNISLTMANDSLLKECLTREKTSMHDESYIETIKEYLSSYQKKYNYDSVFLVSSTTGRYYNFNGVDRVLTPDNPENVWYYELLKSDEEYQMNVDNDEVAGADNAVSVFVNCKIKDAAGETMGVVGIGLRVDSLQALLGSYASEFEVNAYLINNRGVIQISSEHSGYEAVNLFHINHMNRVVQQNILEWKEAGESYSFWTGQEDNPEKKDYIVTRYLPELEWHLVIERDTGAFMEQLKTQMLITIFIIIAIISVILVVVTYVIRSFNRKIVSLTQAVEQERKSMFERATEQLFENIYELDITNNCPANKATEAYFESLGAPPKTPFDKALHIIANKQIKKEYRQGYLDTFSPENVKKAFNAGEDSLRYEFLTSNGSEYYWMRITTRMVLQESDGTLHMLVYRQNIDSEKRQEQRMQELAQTDEMTGFLTKTAIGQHIDKILKEEPSQKYAFFIFDIDNFKSANDRHGHAFGDTVIENFTKTIQSYFTKDALMGRIGGDEFAVFSPAQDLDWARNKAQELSNALHQTFSKDAKSWNMSASIGVALYPDNGADYEALYCNADTALYQSKARGKNCFTVYQGD